MKKKILFILFVIICIGSIIACQVKPSNSSNFQQAIVEYVYDGDTIEVLIDSQEIKVRMIGVDTPESVNEDETKNCEEGIIASDYTKSQLTEGKTIYLEYDEDLYDNYGRTLAYVWLSDDVNTNSFSDFKQYNFGALLLQNTYCKAVYYAPNGKYKEWYEQLDSHNY